ncbi:MAG: response regulator transcription factor [Ignavibacteriota bacterium]
MRQADHLVIASPRNCYRCGKEFRTDTGKRVCPACAAPKITTPIALHASLSLREKQVVALVVSGKLNKEIAFALGLTEGTVKEYMNRIFRKVGCSNRTQLAVWAIGPRLTE